MLRTLIVVVLVTSSTAGVARAADISTAGLKLIVVDKMAAAGKAKAVFVAKNSAISKGPGTDPAQIEATLNVAYDSVSGTFAMPQGVNWLVNSPSVAKYVNKDAPTGGSVKVSVIKPNVLVKVVGKSLGDSPLSISSPPSGPVYVVDTIVNGGDEVRLCTQFIGCVHKLIAGDTGYKLICKGNSIGDPACTAAGGTTTTTTTSTTTTTMCFQDLGDGTILDTCTGLQWEKKTTAVGSGVNSVDLHDVDNPYWWSGACSVTVSKRCQPNLAAETACKAHTDMAYWASGCDQCTGGEGTCMVESPSITTVWDWLAQVNAANFAGHNDWRLPSESGCNSCWSGPPTYTCTSCDDHELETILLSSYECGTSPCIHSIFGPTMPFAHWSASPDATDPTRAWAVGFGNGIVNSFDKVGADSVRAVRGGS